MKPHLARFLLNVWPPFLGAGIRVRYIARDWSEARVELVLRRLNRNVYGNHFGGSLYAMTDPFFALLAMQRLGRDYMVAHQSGMIDYLEPAAGLISASFHFTDAQLADIMLKTASGQKVLPSFAVDLFDRSGRVVARATHLLHVRRLNPVSLTTGAAYPRSALLTNRHHS